MEPCDLSAHAAVQAMREGQLESRELVQSCLLRIDEREEAVGAWAHLDRDYALAQADAVDAARRAGHPVGPLLGLPVGLKDIIDTRDMPTEDGTVLHAGRTPEHDATVVSRLRAAGAVILGKTVTTELAVMSPAGTRNPHDPGRTPGGSSSGSAAAVASGMVPLALGTQTNGSTIRPAAFCGVFGFKPTHGLVSRHGVLRQSRVLDQMGFFGRSVEDVALVAETAAGYDGNDPDTRPRATPPLLRVTLEEPPLTPRLAFVRSPVWDEAAQDTREAFAELVEHLGDAVEEVELSGRFDDVVEWHRTIMESDLALSFAREYQQGRDQLSDVLRGMIERGLEYRAVDYNRAVNMRAFMNEMLGELFEEFDAILTPAVPGEAPVGLDATGNPIFCTLWTYCGTPALSLPLMQGAGGMPLGVQLVGARDDDARLLRTARWLVRTLGEEQ